MSFLLLFLALQLQVAGSPAPAPLSEPVPFERQIDWQRSLEDALALSQAENRPILIAVNMDGETASEIIVRTRYRDPAFVARTRRFVCVASTGFRHGERDHDYDGRRLLSPRLGRVTSGEAMQLEPALFDRYLGGERIAPRHALILPDGTKVFDHFQLFDLRVLDRALEAAESLAPPPAGRVAPLPTTIDLAAREGQAATLQFKLSHADWLRLAGAKDNLGREQFEALLVAPAPIEHVEAALRAIGEAGDAGSCEALRLALCRCGEAPGKLAPLAVEAARARGFEAQLAALVRELLTDIPETGPWTGLGARAELLDTLALLAGGFAPDRSILLSYAVAGEARAERERGLDACRPDAPQELAAAIAAAGGPVDPARVLAAAKMLPREAPWRAPDELAPADAIEAELLAADEHLSANAGDAAAQRRFGKAALDAARSRTATGGSSIELLLEDSCKALEKLLATAPSDVEAWLWLARASYLRADFAGEERAALAALAALPPLAPGLEDRLLGRAPASAAELAAAARALAEPRERLEALRWLADACARQFTARSGGAIEVEAAGMARGFRAASLAALCPISTATDWLTLSGLHAAFGRRGDELEAARTGIEFFPEDQELRTAFYRALWDRGWSRAARRESEEIAARHPQSAASRWYVGYAAMQEGNAQRRAEDPRAAIAAYTLADRAFEESVRAAPGFQASADHYRALAALGRGFAALLVDDRLPAARYLVIAILTLPAIADVRDPLDREPVDLLDGALEWRPSGPSPVDPLALARDLARADPGNTRWARHVSDGELREGLRADGRGEVELGDRYLERSIEAARIAQGAPPSDADRRALAQALCVHAERLIRRASFAAATPLLAEAAALQGEPCPASAASQGEWIELAARLRAQLGAARPVLRPGR